MFGIGNEWWILYILLIVLSVANLYWKLGTIATYYAQKEDGTQ